jgi:hypothetical protein
MWTRGTPKQQIIKEKLHLLVVHKFLRDYAASLENVFLHSDLLRGLWFLLGVGFDLGGPRTEPQDKTLW